MAQLVLDDILGQFIAGSKAGRPSAIPGTVASNLNEPGRMHALQKIISLSKADTEASPGAVRTPSLIVMRSEDADFPLPRNEAELLASLLQASVFMVEDAGHYPHTEMPELVAPGIVAFLRQLK